MKIRASSNPLLSHVAFSKDIVAHQIDKWNRIPDLAIQQSMLMRLFSRKQEPHPSLLTSGKLLVGNDDIVELIPYEEVIVLVVHASGTWIDLIDGSYRISCFTLDHIEARLDDEVFVRVHDRYIVNRGHIRWYHRKRVQVELSTGRRLSVWPSLIPVSALST